MALPQNWQLSKGTTNLYENDNFTVDGVTYQIKVNSTTGGMDIYKKQFSGNVLFARGSGKNDISLVDKDVFLSTLNMSAQQLAKISSDAKALDYFNNKFSLPANQYRANIINNLYPNSTAPFTEMPGVKNVPMAQTTTTEIKPKPESTAGTGIPAIDAVKGTLNAAGKVVELLQDPFKYTEEILNEFNNNRNDSLFKGKILKYPSDILTNVQDCLVIRQHRYVPPYKDIYTVDNLVNIIKDGLTRGKDWIDDDLGTIILPMPSSAQDSNSVSWGEDSLGAVGAAKISEVATNLPLYSALAVAGAGINLGAGTQGADQLLPTALLESQILINGANSKNYKAAAGTGLVSTVLGKAGYETSPESILSRGFGIIPNSNVELLFNGVSLRSFQFSYRMSPRNEQEASQIRQIIRFFKQGMAARKKGSDKSAASFFLQTPNIFELKYTYDGKNEIKGANKFKTCALQNFTVNYAPDGQWMSYDQGQPISVIISMAFYELDPIYNQDYDSEIDNVGY